MISNIHLHSPLTMALVGAANQQDMGKASTQLCPARFYESYQDLPHVPASFYYILVVEYQLCNTMQIMSPGGFSAYPKLCAHWLRLCAVVLCPFCLNILGLYFSHCYIVSGGGVCPMATGKV